jgi:hypothetical protein
MPIKDTKLILHSVAKCYSSVAIVGVVTNDYAMLLNYLSFTVALTLFQPTTLQLQGITLC